VPSQGLKVGAATFVTALEWLALVGARIAVAEAGATLLVGPAAIGGVLSSFEATAKITFVLIEVSAVQLVGFFLGIAEAQPPHFPGAINAFGACVFQNTANGFDLLVIGREGDDRGMALPQRVFVDEQFIFRKSVGSGAFHRSASDTTSDCAEDSSCEANGQDGTDARNKKASQERRQRARSG